MQPVSVLDVLSELTDEEIEALPPDKLRQLKATYEAALTLRSPADFATRLSGGQWLPYPHLVHTSNRIVAMVERDETDLLIIEEPVRHGKTELCSRWTPAWFIAKYRKPVLLSSYEADYAATHGRKVREIIAAHGSRFGLEIDNTSRASQRWELTGGMGGMNTAGAGGPITGKGGYLNIVDDPIKNNEEANSLTMREHLWDWWQSTWLTRREPGVKWLLIMSRWHEDDIVGRILKSTMGMRVERVRLPAIAEDGDDLGRVPGQALCPERFDEVSLAGIRTDVGPTAWSALYQQRPMPRGGGMFRKSAFKFWSAATPRAGETYYQLGEHLVDDRECWRFATMDPAFTRSKRSDFTVCAVWAVAPTDPHSLMLLDLRRVRVEHAEHAPLVKEMWDQWQPAWVGIEKQMATLSLFDDVQRRGVVVRWLTPDRNKIARAETAVAVADAGRIYLPANAPWLPDFLDEVVSFPVAAHDDQVDVLSYAAAELAKRTVTPRKLRNEPETPSDRCWEQLKKRDRTRRFHPVLGRI